MLRAQYLLHVVTTICVSGQELTITDVTKEQYDFLSALPDKLRPHVDKLAQLDTICSSNDWAIKWAEILKKSTCETSLLNNVKAALRVPEPSPSDQKQSDGAGLVDRANLLRSLRQRMGDMKSEVKSPKETPTKGRVNVCSCTLCFCHH